MCLSKDLTGHVRRSKVVYCPSVLLLLNPSRPDDSAMRVDQQEWGAAGQKSVPPGHGAGGLGHPGALSGRAGCAVSNLLHPKTYIVFSVVCTRQELSPRSLVKFAAVSCLVFLLYSILSTLVLLYTPAVIMLLVSAPIFFFLNWAKRFCYCSAC